MEFDLPPCNRHIATHDSNGRSIYVASPPQQHFHPSETLGGYARSYSVANIPAVLESDADVKGYLSSDNASVTSFQRPELVLPSENGNSGASCLVIDIKPGGYSQMHRTVSIDFSICVIGTIVHELYSGERVVMKPGDHIVQRGTNHRWINASKTEPARFVAVLLPCVPFDISGKPLEQVFSADEPSYVPKV